MFINDAKEDGCVNLNCQIQSVKTFSTVIILGPSPNYISPYYVCKANINHNTFADIFILGY